jgi:prepilin-type N-terminal cleavage/methylation domain-containing protein
MADKRGFTLLELMFVSVIMLALVGMTVPRLNRAFPYYALKSSSKNLTALMRYAQNLAVVEQNCYRVNVDLEKNSYWLTRKSSLSGGSQENYDTVGTSLGKVHFLPQTLSFHSFKLKDSRLSGQKYLSCYPDGYIDEATVVIVNKFGDNLSVISGGRIGRVTIKEE